MTTTKRSYVREADKYDANGDRLCVDCQYFLPIEKFHYESVRARFQSRCMKCSSLRNHYGINRRDFDEMMTRQDGACAICRVELEGASLHVDHDHNCCPTRYTCGDCLRGLLCQGCNIGIGHFADSIERMELAIAYLKKTGGRR